MFRSFFIAKNLPYPNNMNNPARIRYITIKTPTIFSNTSKKLGNQSIALNRIPPNNKTNKQTANVIIRVL